MNRLARLGLLVAVAMTLLAPGAPASAYPANASFPAQAPAPPADGGPVTFGIRPASATAPDDRGRFVIGATPGGTVQDFVAVNNVGAQPLTVRLYAGDAFNTPEGGFDLLAAGKPSHDVGAWIALDRDSVTVPGGGVQIVPFRLTVPVDATPGDHAAGIVASLTTERIEADGSKVTVDNRVGARVYLRVAGDLRAQLSVEDVATTYNQNLNPIGAGSATVTYTVRNRGNLRLEGDQRVEVTLPWGSRVEAAALPKVPELLPGSSITQTATVPDVWPGVLPTATVRLVPTSLPGDIDPALPASIVDSTFLAVPLTLLGLLLLLAVFLLVRRDRRRRAARRRTGPIDSVEVGV